MNTDLPLLEIIEIKRTNLLLLKKQIYNEEKSSSSPVASVEISNISKNKVNKTVKKQDKIFIHIASFYSVKTAEFLVKRITNELTELDIKKLKIRKVNNKETQVILGPYISVNLLKNDYIKLQKFGFEELNIFTNE